MREEDEVAIPYSSGKVFLLELGSFGLTHSSPVAIPYSSGKVFLLYPFGISFFIDSSSNPLFIGKGISTVRPRDSFRPTMTR